MTYANQIDRRSPRAWISGTRLVRSVSVAASFAAAITIAATALIAQSRDEVIRVETELATFEVTVTDPSGLPVTGLKADEFRILENGVERKIDFFQPILSADRRRPLLVVFALDVSGSMTEEEIGRLRAAMAQFMRRLSSPDAYFSVVAFAMNVRMLQGFSNRPEQVLRSLDRMSHDQAGLSTHAYDAVDHAVRSISRNAPRSVRGRVPKRSVVVITDGFPVGDTVAPATVIERAQAAEVSVYSIILPSYSRLQGNKRPVLTPFEASDLVARTGGASFYANDENLEPFFAKLADEITGSYAIAFYPDEARGRDEFRRVVVESRSGMKVRQNRDGYRPK